MDETTNLFVLMLFLSGLYALLGLLAAVAEQVPRFLSTLRRRRIRRSGVERRRWRAPPRRVLVPVNRQAVSRCSSGSPRRAPVGGRGVRARRRNQATVTSVDR